MKTTKRIIAPSNNKATYNTAMTMFAAIMNGEVDRDAARDALPYMQEANRAFENELKVMALTGNALRRIEKTAFDDTTGQDAIMPIKRIS